MESAEERLAKITGQPVVATGQPVEAAADQPIDAAAGQPDDDVDSRDSATSANGDIVGHLDPTPSVAPEPVPRFLQPVPDPPLEHLERVPSLNSDFSPSLDMDMLSGLLSGGSTTNSSGPIYQVKVYHCLWLFLAVLVRLLLGSSHSYLIGDNILVPFLLTVTGLLVTGKTDIRGLQSASLLTAVFVLCGVSAEKVATLTRCLHGGRLLLQCFSIYLFSFIITHFGLELLGLS